MTVRSRAVQIRGKLSYREDLVRLWSEAPRTTVADAQRKTGAPQSVVIKVRRDLVDAGQLKAGAPRW